MTSRTFWRGIAAIAVCASCASGGGTHEVDLRIEALRRDLTERVIRTVEVQFIPYELETRTRVTPEDFRGYAKSIRKAELDGELRTTLIEALDDTRATPLHSPPDLRWAAIFRDANDVERHAVYVDGGMWLWAGRHGIVDGESASLNGALIRWLERHFEELMKRPS